MAHIAEVIKSKTDHHVHCVAPGDTVLSALKLMAEKGIGALLVMDAGKIAGIFTERDYARKMVLLGRSSGDTPVREVMTSKVRYVHPEQSVEQCMALMTENRLRHLPVVAGDKVIGLVSIGDLVKHTITQQQFIINQMEQYITNPW